MKGMQCYILWCLHPKPNEICLAILQRVTSASVTVDQQLISSIGRGILVFAAVGKEDTEKDADSLAAKILKVKLWPDETSNGTVCPSPSGLNVCRNA